MSYHGGECLVDGEGTIAVYAAPGKPYRDFVVEDTVEGIAEEVEVEVEEIVEEVEEAEAIETVR